jgi:hypothetical protein
MGTVYEDLPVFLNTEVTGWEIPSHGILAWGILSQVFNYMGESLVMI